ncbi:MAG: hypothetical protein ACW98D_17475 [Promethearchaeota archaeon]
MGGRYSLVTNPISLTSVNWSIRVLATIGPIRPIPAKPNINVAPSLIATVRSSITTELFLP